MYHKAYGIIETLAPLHVGASAGEETGNLNLIFRDQFTQTGIIPGSSIRGRFRADMRGKRQKWLEQQLANQGVDIPDPYQQEIEVEKDGKTTSVPRLKWLESQAKPYGWNTPSDLDEHLWYGHEAVEGQNDGGTTEALVKFEYASLLWLPVFCPGQPVVWVSSPRLLARYKLMNPSIIAAVPEAYTAAKTLEGKPMPGAEGQGDRKLLFFNLGYMEIPNLVEEADLTPWIEHCQGLKAKNVVIVNDNDIAMIHDMALFRQTRVKLADTEKKVSGGAFFNVEALPEGSYLAFPVALKLTDWQPFGTVIENEAKKRNLTQDLYFGGLESIGFGHCRVTLGEF